MTDSEWEVLGPETRQLMAELRRGPGGRPMLHDPRAMLDAIRYVTRYGVQWRALPVDFPPWDAVYAFFERWSAWGLPDRLVGRLRGRLRVAMGRHELPTAGLIDSQSVKAADTVGAGTRGFDGGKKINGRKRHIAVDTLGLVLAVVVTAASVQDRDGACPLSQTQRRHPRVGGPTPPLGRRTNIGWLMRHRRLVRDYERRPEHHEAMVLWATVMIMTRQLVRHTSANPPPPRWGGARPAPAPKPDKSAA